MVSSILQLQKQYIPTSLSCRFDPIDVLTRSVLRLTNPLWISISVVIYTKSVDLIQYLVQLQRNRCESFSLVPIPWVWRDILFVQNNTLLHELFFAILTFSMARSSTIWLFWNISVGSRSRDRKNRSRDRSRRSRSHSKDDRRRRSRSPR